MDRPAFASLVIIDESEQVLAHLFGKTIEARLGVDQCFDALMSEVANAKSVYLLDADLGLTRHTRCGPCDRRTGGPGAASSTTSRSCPSAGGPCAFTRTSRSSRS